MPKFKIKIQVTRGDPRKRKKRRGRRITLPQAPPAEPKPPTFPL
jgi:hypothetical protein